MGDRGSPCLTLLQCNILLPGIPLTSTEDEVVHPKEEIQFLHLWPNSKWVKMLNK
jgi:hypothetical protein